MSEDQARFTVGAANLIFVAGVVIRTQGARFGLPDLYVAIGTALVGAIAAILAASTLRGVRALPEDARRAWSTKARFALVLSGLLLAVGVPTAL